MSKNTSLFSSQQKIQVPNKPSQNRLYLALFALCLAISASPITAARHTYTYSHTHRSDADFGTMFIDAFNAATRTPSSNDTALLRVALGATLIPLSIAAIWNCLDMPVLHSSHTTTSYSGGWFWGGWHTTTHHETTDMRAVTAVAGTCGTFLGSVLVVNGGQHLAQNAPEAVGAVALLDGLALLYKF